jgi:hypothetical protein
MDKKKTLLLALGLSMLSAAHAENFELHWQIGSVVGSTTAEGDESDAGAEAPSAPSCASIDTSSPCYNPDNVGTVGPAGSICEGMLIVNRSMLFDNATWYYGGDESYSVTGPDATEYTFGDDENNIFTGQVENLAYLFYASATAPDIGYWDTAQVTSLAGLFYATGGGGDLSNWETGCVESMNSMFDIYAGTWPGTDLANWDTSSVQSMDRMFADTALGADISGLKTDGVASCTDFAKNSSSLQGQLPSFSSCTP